MIYIPYKHLILLGKEWVCPVTADSVTVPLASGLPIRKSQNLGSTILINMFLSYYKSNI